MEEEKLNWIGEENMTEMAYIVTKKKGTPRELGLAACREQEG